MYVCTYMHACTCISYCVVVCRGQLLCTFVRIIVCLSACLSVHARSKKAASCGTKISAFVLSFEKKKKIQTERERSKRTDGRTERSFGLPTRKRAKGIGRESESRDGWKERARNSVPTRTYARTHYGGGFAMGPFSPSFVFLASCLNSI